jgi:hypothetical protein
LIKSGDRLMPVPRHTRIFFFDSRSLLGAGFGLKYRNNAQLWTEGQGATDVECANLNGMAAGAYDGRQLIPGSLADEEWSSSGD